MLWIHVKIHAYQQQQGFISHKFQLKGFSAQLSNRKDGKSGQIMKLLLLDTLANSKAENTVLTFALKVKLVDDNGKEATCCAKAAANAALSP